MPNSNFILSHFAVAGINYRKSDVDMRGKFFVTPEQSIQILKEASKRFQGCFILSTCNRTEIYGITNDPCQLVDLLCRHIEGTPSDFMEYGYIEQGTSAVEHFFKVTAGLDSQIIGDYEILSQVKRSAQNSRENGCLSGFMEKIVNFSLQASKSIKTNTKLSSGTVSVSYAAIEIIKSKIKVLDGKKILVVGTGKFGHHVGKNLKKYLPGCSLYFCNRTDEKAYNLAVECTADFIPYDQLSVVVDKADIIVVSSAADSFTVIPSFFTSSKPRLILDLSIPQNVDPGVKEIDGVDLLNVDEISRMLEQTVSARNAEVPKALSIIDDTLQQVISWSGLQSNNRILRTIKSQLHTLAEKESSALVNQEQIQKTVSSLAMQLRSNNNKGCQCIHAINNYLQFNYEAAC